MSFRTSSHSIPIKEREDVLKNGPKTIVLPPPLYLDAIDIGLKRVDEKTNPLLLVKELPVYVSNVQNSSTKMKSAEIKVYRVEIYKKKDQGTRTKFQVSTKSVSASQPIGCKLKQEAKPPLALQVENSDIQSKSFTCFSRTKNINQGIMKSENSNIDRSSAVSTLQTLLNHPKDIVIQRDMLSKHLVHVAPKNSNPEARNGCTLAVPNLSDKKLEGSHEMDIDCTEPDSPGSTGSLEVLENYEETNVTVANLETTTTQPMSAQSVQIFHHGDHSYFVIGNNKDLDGANIQEVVIGNSGLSLPISDQKPH